MLSSGEMYLYNPAQRTHSCDHGAWFRIGDKREKAGKGEEPTQEAEKVTTTRDQCTTTL
jgi:hypothetical protein